MILPADEHAVTFPRVVDEIVRNDTEADKSNLFRPNKIAGKTDFKITYIQETKETYTLLDVILKSVYVAMHVSPGRFLLFRTFKMALLFMVKTRAFPALFHTLR